MNTALFAGFAAFVIAVILLPIIIRTLKRLGLTQPIRKELPQNHQLKKGTPLMAGMSLLIGVCVSIYFYPNPSTFFLGAIFVLFGLVGFLDDFRKAYHQDPGGISGKLKLVLQFAFTAGLLYFGLHQGWISSHVRIFKDISWTLPVAVYAVLIALFIVGSANAINFTDGLDGLLSIVAIPTYFFFFIITKSPEIQVFCLTMVGCLLAFLIFNIHPAKAFMGDTGSLAIGGSLAFLAVLERVEILVPILFIIYFAEQLSVIIQVAYFKRTGKRIFRMSPIHYHFALKYGWSENTIVTIFGLTSWVAAILCYLYWHLFLGPVPSLM